MYVCVYGRMRFCMYARMHACTYACMDECMYGCLYVRTYVRTCVCMYGVCMNVCMDVWLYGCMDVWTYGRMAVSMYVCMYACKLRNVCIWYYVYEILPACRRVWLEGAVPVCIFRLYLFLCSLAPRFCFA